MYTKMLGLVCSLVACSAVYAAGENPTATPAPAATPATTPVPAAIPAAAPVATPAPAAATISLSGKWSSNSIGDVSIEQTGDKIVGTYQYEEDDGITQDGKIEGLVKDKTVQAKWWQRPKVGSGEESRGDLEWKIADDGKMLSGWYREEGDKEKYDFNLERK